MMQVIFLDFDGVLNNATTGQLGERSIVRATGAVVVVSSAWRLNGTIDWLQSVLDADGFEGRVVGKTQRVETEFDRGER